MWMKNRELAKHLITIVINNGLNPVIIFSFFDPEIIRTAQRFAAKPLPEGKGGRSNMAMNCIVAP